MNPKIGVVGPCAAGKSTLVEGLKKLGYNAKNIAQEHSYVPGMWARITHPDLLVFLDVSYEVSMQRRTLNWTPADYAEEQRRLENARQHAHFYLHTDSLSAEETLAEVVAFLTASQVNPASE